MKRNCSDTYFFTKKIIHCCNIHYACDLSMDPINDEPPPWLLNPSTALPPSPPHWETSIDYTTVTGDDDACDLLSNDSHHMSVLCANDLLGCKFLMDQQQDGQCNHACIVEFIQYHEHALWMSDDHHKFRVSINDDEYEEIITYNELTKAHSSTPILTLKGKVQCVNGVGE
jgi:hypothetical protein